MSIIRKDPIKSITHWEPFHELERLQREMNHLFDSWAPLSLSLPMASGFAPLELISKESLKSAVRFRKLALI